MTVQQRKQLSSQPLRAPQKNPSKSRPKKGAALKYRRKAPKKVAMKAPLTAPMLSLERERTREFPRRQQMKEPMRARNRDRRRELLRSQQPKEPMREPKRKRTKELLRSQQPKEQMREPKEHMRDLKRKQLKTRTKETTKLSRLQHLSKQWKVIELRRAQKHLMLAKKSLKKRRSMRE